MPPTSLQVHRATSFWQRLGGLLARQPLRDDEALLLAPCNSVHTFFMRYPIDVAFLDRDGRVMKLVRDLAPWRVAGCVGAKAALELRAGRSLPHGIALETVVREGGVNR